MQCHLPHTDKGNLCLHSFILITLPRSLSILQSSSKNQLLVSLIFYCFLFFFVPLISTLILVISFLLLIWGFICSSFPHFLRLEAEVINLRSCFYSNMGLQCFKCPSNYLLLYPKSTNFPMLYFHFKLVENTLYFFSCDPWV